MAGLEAERTQLTFLIVVVFVASLVPSIPFPFLSRTVSPASVTAVCEE